MNLFFIQLLYNYEKNVSEIQQNETLYELIYYFILIDCY